MAVLKILANLEILHWSMQYFCMDGLYLDMGSSGIFGGIFGDIKIGVPLEIAKRHEKSITKEVPQIMLQWGWGNGVKCSGGEIMHLSKMA